MAVPEGNKKPSRLAAKAAAISRDQQALLALAEEAGGLGIFEWEVPAGEIRLSSKFLSLYGLDNYDGRYETWLKSIFREDVLRIADEIENAFGIRAATWNAEYRIVHGADGTLKWMEARGVIFYDADGAPLRVVGINVDVTERKRALLQLRSFTEALEERVRERTRELELENEARMKAEEALRQLQKMEAVGQLTGGVAHDFNNLLTIVQGGLDMIGRQIPLLGDLPATPRIARGKDMAMEGVRRAIVLTSRLLAFSRQQPLVPKSLDCNKLVAGVCELLQRTLGEPTSLETVLAAGLWRTLADANQLENALLNLALNARDAMPDGGKVTIETANCYLDDSYIRHLSEPVKPGQYVMIAVADNGTGMEPSTLARVFEPFFTTKDIGKGTGLGLSQVYGFVRQSAGHVAIYSELGEGTTVKIYLPRHKGGGDRRSDRVEPRKEIKDGGAETILIVEDDDALRSYTLEILTDLGYCVLAAANGMDALAILERAHHIDLLFTDIVMPGGMTGRQLADQALERRPEMKVLFTTGYTRNAIVHHGRLDPDVELIGKPFTFDELGVKVREILDGN